MDMENRVLFSDDVCECGLSNEALTADELNSVSHAFAEVHALLTVSLGKHIPHFVFIGDGAHHVITETLESKGAEAIKAFVTVGLQSRDAQAMYFDTDSVTLQ